MLVFLLAYLMKIDAFVRIFMLRWVVTMFICAHLTSRAHTHIHLHIFISTSLLTSSLNSLLFGSTCSGSEVSFAFVIGRHATIYFHSMRNGKACFLLFCAYLLCFSINRPSLAIKLHCFCFCRICIDFMKIVNYSASVVLVNSIWQQDFKQKTNGIVRYKIYIQYV